MKAHKVVLAACSHFFKSILRESVHPHPLVYLQGVNQEYLELLKRFMYLGRASMKEEEMDSFVMTSKTFLNKEYLAPNKTDNMDKEILEHCFNASSASPASTSVESPGLVKPTTNRKAQYQKGVRKCDLCDFSSNKVKIMIHHKQKLHGRTVHTCDKCDFLTTNIKRLTTHNMEKHDSYTCNSCPFVTNTRLNLTGHYSNEHYNTIIKCIFCNFQCLTQKNMDKHMNSKHIVTEEQNDDDDVHKKFKCPDCDHVDTNKARFQKHTRRHSQTFTCDECDYTCHEGSLFSLHKETHNKLIYVCDQCGHASKTRRTNLLHVRKVHLGITYDCDSCPYKAKNMYNLKSHTKAVHEKVKIYCDFCTYNDSVNSRVQLHMKRNHITIESNETTDK
jgi:KRAB domain-containing zinc finger protein